MTCEAGQVVPGWVSLVTVAPTAAFQPFSSLYALLTLPKMEMGTGMSFKERLSFAPLILP